MNQNHVQTVKDVSIFTPMDEVSQSGHKETQTKLIRFDDYKDRDNFLADQDQPMTNRGTMYDQFFIPQVNNDYTATNSGVTNSRPTSKELNVFPSRQDLHTQ